MPTTFLSAVRLDDRFDRVDFGSPVLFDLGSAMTIAVLVFVPSVPVDVMLASRDNGTAGWSIFLNSSSGLDLIFRGVTTNDYSRFNGALTLNAWNWIFAKWNGTAWAVRSGLYNAVNLTTQTRSSLSTLTGGMTSTVGRLLRVGFSEAGGNAASINKYTFFGVWNTVLVDATVDTYSADMIGSGGAAAAVEYWKWAATDTTSITGSKASTVGAYTGILAGDIVAGPDGVVATGGSAVVDSNLLRSLLSSRLIGG